MRYYQSVVLAIILMGGVVGLLAWLAKSRIISKTRAEYRMEVALALFLSTPQMQLQGQEIAHLEIPAKAKRTAGFLIFPDLKGVNVEEVDGVAEVTGELFTLAIFPMKDSMIEGHCDRYVDAVKNLASPATMHEKALGLEAKKEVLEKASLKFAVVCGAEQVFYGTSPSSGAIVSYRDDAALEILWWPDRKVSRCLVVPGTQSDPSAIPEVFHFLLNASIR